LEAEFLKEAEKQKMFQLFGHPLFGGLRVTLYNGIPCQAVDTLAQFMHSFQAAHK
jgi:phosphoserine aminotransferase